MWSKDKRRSFRESEETRERIAQWGKSLKEAKVTYELLGVEMSGRRARAKVGVTISGQGERHVDVDYEHWVFEHGDWYIDDVGRTE